MSWAVQQVLTGSSSLEGTSAFFSLVRVYSYIKLTRSPCAMLASCCSLDTVMGVKSGCVFSNFDEQTSMSKNFLVYAARTKKVLLFSFSTPQISDLQKAAEWIPRYAPRLDSPVVNIWLHLLYLQFSKHLLRKKDLLSLTTLWLHTREVAPGSTL